MVIEIDEKRSTNEELERQRQLVMNNRLLIQALNGINIYELILNVNREIIFVNDTLSGILNLKNDDLLGIKPGEMVKCKNAIGEGKGCGSSKECELCLGRKLFEETVKTGKTSQGDIYFISIFEGLELKSSFQKKVTKLDIEGEDFYLFSLIDKKVSYEKKEMDRVFLHDILNAATGLYNTIRLLQMKNEKFRDDQEIQSLENYVMNIIDDIEYQRNITRAEKDNLEPIFTSFDIGDLCNDVLNFIKKDERFYKIEIEYRQSHKENEIITDKSLIRRIIMNILKNALEANEGNTKVVFRLDQEKYGYNISVHNDELIPEDIKKNLFERGNSSKGKGRGFGIYGTKFILNKYLKGEIRFISEKGKGTTFIVEIPKEAG